MEINQLLQGKVAMVTGAGRGIGRAIATALAAHGASVGLNDITPQAIAGTEEALRSAGHTVITLPGSVADASAVDGMITSIEQSLGRVDILVNNAGINRDALLVKMNEAQWREVLDIDLTGPFLIMHRVLPSMIERRGGRIINISSASWQGNVGQANYAAAKAGIVALTKTASRETAKYGITANAICPGFIETEMTKNVPSKIWDMMVAKIPAGRVGTPEDVAKTVVFLASSYADYITGEVINVGGGMIL